MFYPDHYAFEGLASPLLLLYPFPLSRFQEGIYMMKQPCWKAMFWP